MYLGDVLYIIMVGLIRQCKNNHSHTQNGEENCRHNWKTTVLNSCFSIFSKLVKCDISCFPLAPFICKKNNNTHLISEHTCQISADLKRQILINIFVCISSSFAGMRDTLKALITRKEEKPSQNGRGEKDRQTKRHVQACSFLLLLFSHRMQGRAANWSAVNS